jgi:hypothetical protein
MIFFRIIANPEVLSSALLEMNQGDICGIIYGYAADRLIQLFQFDIERFKIAESLIKEDLVCTLRVFLDVCRLRRNKDIDPKINILGTELTTIIQ